MLKYSNSDACSGTLMRLSVWLAGGGKPRPDPHRPPQPSGKETPIGTVTCTLRYLWDAYEGHMGQIANSVARRS